MSGETISSMWEIGEQGTVREMAFVWKSQHFTLSLRGVNVKPFLFYFQSLNFRKPQADS